VHQKEVLNVGIVCGEHSGDMLGADLIEELKKQYEVNLFGVGGPKLELQGLESVFHFSEINIMGLIEPFFNYLKLVKLRKNLINLFINKKIDIFVGIDSPDFNIGIHKALKKQSTNKNIQLVSPSVWGWRQGRIKSIKSYIDLTLCLFDFEHSYYKKEGHNSFHIGHPFFKSQKENDQKVFKKYNLESSKKFLSVLPGSRVSEIKNMLPVYVDFIREHSENNKNYFYLVPATDKKLSKLIHEFISHEDLPILIAENSVKDFLSISEVSIVTSGTATLESAILGCPPVICYKTNFLNYLIISRMLKIQDVGLPNLLYGKRHYIELIQNQCNVENIINAVNETLCFIPNREKDASFLRNALKGKGYPEAIKAIRTL
jgi:lipid-A-disaccharide synthase|tara:strand:+ start:11132 stop:12253 length:1122 start_codon:yes stop_codon:yes gene_type:complete